MITLYNIAEQVKAKTGKGTWQEVIQEVRNAYSYIAKGIWFENKKNDVGEVDGAFVISFKNQQPKLDTDLNKYYVDISSTYLQLPQECGVVSVSYMSEIETNFVMVNSGSYGRLSRIKAGVMGGRQLYYVDNMKMFFPRMTNITSTPLMVRLALALDEVDVDAPLNISATIQESIVNLVVSKYIQIAEKRLADE